MGAAAPVGHCSAAVIERDNAGHRFSAMAHGEDVGIVSKTVDHRIEQRAREYRSAEIAIAFSKDGIVRRPVPLVERPPPEPPTRRIPGAGRA